MNTLDTQYQQLLSDIIEFGVEKKDRTGTGTISEFGHQIRHKMSEGFPLLTTKKMAWKTMVTELLWFLNGDTNIKYLVDNNCHIWDGDAYKNYQTKMTEWFGNESQLTKEQFIDKIKTDNEFASKWGDLGPIYGKQWRNWESVDTSQFWQEDWSSKNTDQIQNLIEQLKTNPDSRRLMVSAWNVGELNQMVLPPCHYGFQVWTREENGQRYLSLMWNQRSVDTLLGLPFNIASYGLLLEIIAKEVNMIPDELIGNLGDTHLYSNHIQQAKEQISREPFKLPNVKIAENVKRAEGDCLPIYKVEDFIIENYQSHPTIKATLSN